MSIRPGGSEQRTAIVTGAARGIGAATAMALAARGIAPALFVRDPGAASGIAERIRDLGVACRVETCDVADYGSVRAALARTADAWGRLDAVINNAGTVEPMGFIADTDPGRMGARIRGQRRRRLLTSFARPCRSCSRRAAPW